MLPADPQNERSVMLSKSAMHGHSKYKHWTPTYYSWAAMVSRCTNPSRNVFHLYGGRGIRVCDRWRVFANFLADMGERPAGKSIGRIDPDGHYEPGNCEWQDSAAQARTTRTVKLTAEKATEIRSRRLAGETIRSLAETYGVSETWVKKVVRGAAWA